MNLAIALLSTPRHLISNGYPDKSRRLSRIIPPDIADEIVRRRQAGVPWIAIEDWVRAAGVTASSNSIQSVWARYRNKDW